MRIDEPPFIAGARNGITLLEVLIAIGILAVGLSSVVALIPAGRSQAARAVILDRANNLAANALSDAATFGLLRPDSLTIAAGFVVIDPEGTGTFGPPTALTAVRRLGIFSGTTDPAAGGAVQSLFTVAADDVVFQPGATGDDLPLNEMTDGVRAFQGRMSCIYGIQSGTPGRLSAIVFHARDPQASPVSLSLTNGAVSGVSTDLTDIVKPGAVLWSATPTPRFHQVTSFTIVAATATGFFTFSTGTALLTGAHTVHVLPNSVGLAERPFTAEESGAYLQ